MLIEFQARDEGKPGQAWQEVVAHGWPGWRRWYEGHITAGDPDLDASRAALQKHMPEIVTLWERLIEAVDGDEVLARFLSYWTPPRYMAHCSQLAFIDGEGPALIRNYDLDPKLSEATLYRTEWRAYRVIGMVDGLSGLADGMNEAGLAVSLAFGGRPVMGRGFGVPLIVRYILETCRDVQDAVSALRRVPSHMSYNLTMIDRAGAAVTVFVAPDRPVMVRQEAYATNHQIGVEWTSHATQSKTLEREMMLSGAAANPGFDAGQARTMFTDSTLRSRNFARNFATVYTALYRPLAGSVGLYWAGGQSMIGALDGPMPPKQTVNIAAETAPALDAAPATSLPYVKGAML